VTKTRALFAFMVLLVLAAVAARYVIGKPIADFEFTPTTAPFGQFDVRGNAKVDEFNRLVAGDPDAGKDINSVYATMTFDLPVGGEYALRVDYTETENEGTPNVRVMNLSRPADSAFSDSKVLIDAMENTAGTATADPAKPTHSSTTQPNLVLFKGPNKVIVSCSVWKGASVVENCPIFHKFRFERVYKFPGLY
jgi:hypothetical protein